MKNADTPHVCMCWRRFVLCASACGCVSLKYSEGNCVCCLCFRSNDSSEMQQNEFIHVSPVYTESIVLNLNKSHRVMALERNEFLNRNLFPFRRKIKTHIIISACKTWGKRTFFSSNKIGILLTKAAKTMTTPSAITNTNM